ncbi:MAG: ATP-binding protein [Chloroflexi bacterium]|nr:MAG: ATP-binding protein [Chloroflexota bacterium]
MRQGRALVPAPWSGDGNATTKVRLDQLPSGEQQCLLLFGELARRRREGAIIAIDEPEISLHPTLQRRVVHQLGRFAREWDSQIILATHSLEVLRAVHASARIILDQLAESVKTPPPAA